jgi:diguanylate cyclase (GGDEF)-like protein
MSYVGLLNDISNEMILPDERERFQQEMAREKLIETFKQGNPKINFEYRVGKNLNNFYWIRVCINFILEPMQGDVCALIYVQNITDKKLRELKLQSRAERDLLSKLYNRITTQQKAEKLLANAKPNEMLVLFMIDLDNFKQINDSLGHLYGDAVIIETAHRLKHIFRENDVVGRLGGDEFAIFIPNVPTVDFIEEKAKNICTSMSAPVLFDNIPKSVGCSIGIAYTTSSCSFKDLYEMADKALYVAKSKGKNRYEFYNENM